MIKLPDSNDPIWILIAGATPFAIAAIVMFISCGYYVSIAEYGEAVKVGFNALIASMLPLGVWVIRKLGL